MRFCLEVWGTDYTKIKNTCLRAEELGYDAFYYGESLAELDLDCWTVLAGLAAETGSIKLGPVITYLLPRYRGIALLAKAAATMQEVSKARFEFRTGAGATLQYAAQWWYPYGIDYPDGSERVSMLEEGLQILRMLWEKGAAHLNGKYFTVNGATMQKPSNPIPITVAAKRRRMMQIAAKHAEVWEASYLPPERFAELNAEFDALAREQGRTVRRSIEADVIIASSEEELRHKEQLFVMERGPNILHQVRQHSLVGTPERVAERIKEYAGAGVEQLLLAFQDPLDTDALELFINAVR